MTPPELGLTAETRALMSLVLQHHNVLTNDSTSPTIDQSGPGPSKSSPIQSEKFLDRARTNPQFFGTWTELAWTALDQSIRAESARIRWELLIYLGEWLLMI